jgi:hypothetical protein
MFADKLVPLVMAAKTQLASMKGARLSEKMAVKEKLATDIFALLPTAKDGITDAQKIAAFDKMLDSQIATMTDTMQRVVKGKGYYIDNDNDHYCYEEVVQAVFGSNIFNATNEFDRLFEGLDGS